MLAYLQQCISICLFGRTELHFVITRILSPQFTQNRRGHAFALATQSCLCFNPGFFVMVLDGFSALQFVPPAPVVLAEIKATIFYNAFCPLILQ